MADVTDRLPILPADLTPILQRLDRVAIIAQDSNGPATYNVESAAYGNISNEFRLIIPNWVIPLLRNNALPDNLMGINIDIIQQTQVAYMNWRRMVEENVAQDIALWIAIYRARLIKLGYLYHPAASRKVGVNEVDVDATVIDLMMNELTDGDGNLTQFGNAFNAARDDSGKLMAYVTFGNDNRFRRFIAYMSTKLEMVNDIVFTAENIAASTYLVFRQFGHHYTESLREKYTRIWAATTLAEPALFPGFDMAHRNAVHSFGLKSFHDNFYRNLRLNRLAETFRDRSNVAPCGTAMTATCYATIQLMKALPFWMNLHSAYSQQVDALENEYRKMGSGEEAIAFHKNASFFVDEAQVMKIDNSFAAVLAPLAKGFIDVAGEKSDIARQRTLDKRASQNPVMITMVSSVITAILDRVTERGDIASIAPSVTSGQ